LLGFLKSRYTVENIQQGIYFVNGDTSPTQILVSEELPEEDNFWLTNLRKDLTKEQLSRVFTAAAGRTSIDAYVYAVGEANAETMEELYMQRKKGVILTEKLDAYFTERYAPLIKAKEGAEMVLTALRKKFGQVPEEIEEAVRAMTDSIALASLLEHIFDCDTLDDFAESL
jgi:hypothetical protein